jgi:diaminohydroxyphosphoribosylaminopyrimidine deaminase/5-amino-6-(5-phosphoribosylamino)uracil reductase
LTPDSRFVAAAAALGDRGRGQCAPNPNVGCVVVRDGIVVGRGWTQPGGRPHAEAIALAQAGDRARGATVYVTLEPCAHVSERGPACADALVAAGVSRVVAGLQDPDPRTAGAGFARLEAAGIAVTRNVAPDICHRSIAGFLTRRALGRPHVTLKLAMSLDGRIAMADGSSRWITGAAARAHAHLERARAEAIVVGRGTYDADQPTLDVRLPGLEQRSPRRAMLTRRTPTDGWLRFDSPRAVAEMEQVDHVLVEGGSATAAAFLADDLVDRLLLYRAPILIGGSGRAAIDDIGLGDLADAHGRWRLDDTRMLGSDRLDVYERSRS